MNKPSLILFVGLLAGCLASAQVTVDPDHLSESVKERMMDEITEKIKSSVEQGEKWAANASYFSEILEPFRDFGIDPENPNFLNQAYDLHKKINAELEKNPNLKYSSQLGTEIKGLVKNGLWNYASSRIDNESKEIYNQVSNLLTDGKNKITGLLEAAAGISKLDIADENYESGVTAILKKYGIRSDYFFVIDDLDQVLSAGYEKVADPLSALSTIASAAGSDDPVYKIEMLFELGESYGGKIPVIGSLIKPLFTLGKGVLDAAKGLETILEKNLNQGCINPGGGTYASANPNKRTSFIRKFPNAGRVCPMNQQIFSPVYNNIYVADSNSDELYFYYNNGWEKGKFDNLHSGTDDIYSSIQWLRRNGEIEKATDPGFILSSYQKEYGWSVYSREINKRVNRISTLFQSAYQTVNYCDSQTTATFFMDKMGLNWISRLLSFGGIEFGWEEMKYFNPEWEKEISDQMIRNYYLGKNQHNLNNFDNILKNLSENVPVNIYGTVAQGNGRPIPGATIQTTGKTMFTAGSNCHQVITTANGSFSLFVLLPLGNPININVTATTPDGQTVSEQLPVTPGIKNHYEVNLRTTFSEPEISDENSRDSLPADTSEEIKNSDCGNDPLATAVWDPVRNAVICTCIDDYVWDENQKKCIPDIQSILNHSDCSSYPNTRAVWDNSANEAYCDCLPGFVWNKDYTGCIDVKDQQLASADCSGYVNSQPVWDETTQAVACDCLPGFKWNKENTACLPEWEEALQNADCSAYPNTEPVWDPVAREIYCNCIAGFHWNDDFTGCIQNTNTLIQPYECSQYPNTQPVYDPALNQYFCECLPGFVWNKQRTGCVPERNKPNINWDDILNMTMGILNAANASQPGIGSVNPSSQPPVLHQSNCNDQQQAGGDAPEIHTINLGQTFGTFQFDYNVYTVKDQIIITQGGTTIFNSGCISGSKSVMLNLSGFGNQISVRVNPNCDGNTSGTQWNFTVHCPKN
jgi:hypothetical protein